MFALNEACPQKKKLQVIGYVRQHHIQSEIVNWPLALSYIILSFFYINDEALTLKMGVNDPYAKIVNNDQCVIKKNAYQWITIWGNKRISLKYKRIYKWDFTFNTFNEQPEILIGITNKKSHNVEKSIMHDSICSTRTTKQFIDHYYYCISSKGGKIYKEGCTRSTKCMKFYYNDSLTWGYNNKKVQMILDCKKDIPTLKFIIDGVHKQCLDFYNVKSYNQESKKYNIYTICISLQLFATKSFKMNKFIQE